LMGRAEIVAIFGIFNTEGTEKGHRGHRECQEVDGTGHYAAFVAACVAAGSSQRTDTSFETPGSCIVTP
jgi:hypothetical protein